ncbi:DUF6404 family protein [Undibacterium rugosum]|uniref:DUF6404 family protein n=1 Tax=Undibacterium rugosum TaxID=2762291 RepID=UPI001B8152C5|nr:DUF6404 family protein [Undibacterium rugosum]MBR7778472.1 hypothetical protein [Undibacterium rugosum]
MTSSTRREAALRLLETTGMRKSSYAPPGVLILWRLGIDCPPPHFARFWSLFALSGVYFGIFWGLFMWLFSTASKTPLLESLPLAACFAGGLFGLGMAFYYAYGRKKYQLPLWNELR